MLCVVSFILLDEADFFPPGQQQDARDVSERYIAKSNPYIVLVSTPNAPDGLFERIEKEAEGNNGDDKMSGGPGNDSLLGGPRDDSVSGEDRNDNLFGGSGNDILSGGKGKIISFVA